MDVRPRLFGVAYRILGCAADAEDILQEVWVRWQTADRERVRNPAAFMITATARMAINVLHSARVRRETCVDSTLPEPVDSSPDPGVEAEQREALSRAIVLLLEKLSPAERAAYVLREAFSYPYRQIATLIQVEEANARQLVTRARDHISSARREPVSAAERRCLLYAFVDAATEGDLATLERLFASAVVSASEDCGLARVAHERVNDRTVRRPHRHRCVTPMPASVAVQAVA